MGPAGASMRPPPGGPMQAYEAFQQGVKLLRDGHPHAAVQPLERARELEPEKGSVREALARAYYNSQRYRAAHDEFLETLSISPVNDYAHFGLGLCLIRLGEREAARAHLRLAVAMNPDPEHYRRALAEADG